MLKDGVWEGLVAVMFPTGAGEHSTWAVQRKKVLEAMRTWKAVWAELRAPWTDEADWTAKGRARKGEKLVALAHTFNTAWREAVGKETTHRYMHDLLFHAQDQIARFGWLFPFSAQGPEHKHKQRKQVGRSVTNRRAGGKWPVFAQVMQAQAIEIALCYSPHQQHSHEFMRQQTPVEYRKGGKLTAEVVARRRAGAQAAESGEVVNSTPRHIGTKRTYATTPQLSDAN